MKAQYTPGPWKVGKSYTSEPCIREPNGDAVAVACDLCDGEAKANSHLIAAAPEMYAELRQMTMFLEDYIRFDKPHSKETAMNFLSNINAAIAKAEGR